MTDRSMPGIQSPPPSLPAALREALRRDARHVRPVLPAGVRALFAALAALAAVALFLSWRGLRPDSQSLGPVLLWVPALVRIAAGGALILLTMREAIPGLDTPPPLRIAALLGTPALLVLLAGWVAGGATAEMAEMPMMAGRSAWLCFPRELLAALPAALLTGLLLARAYPLRPGFAATTGALGAGLIADAALHLSCPSTLVSHMLLVHGGAVAALATAAAMTGWLFGRLRFRPHPAL